MGRRSTCAGRTRCTLFELPDTFLSVVGDQVFSRFLIAVIGRLSIHKALNLCIETLSIELRPVTILLSVVVGQQAQCVLRIVLVDGWVGIRPNGQSDKGGVPDHDIGDPQNGRSDDGLLFLAGEANAKPISAARITIAATEPESKGRPKMIDQVDLQKAEQLQGEWDDDLKHQAKDGHRDDVGQVESVTVVLEFLEVIDHSYGRNGQENQNVHPDGQADR